MTNVLTSCSLLNMNQLAGKVHHVWKPFLDGVDKKVHQRLLTVLRLGVYQLTTYNTRWHQASSRHLISNYKRNYKIPMTITNVRLLGNSVAKPTYGQQHLFPKNRCQCMK